MPVAVLQELKSLWPKKATMLHAIWGALPWEQVRDADDKRVDADTHWAVLVLISGCRYCFLLFEKLVHDKAYLQYESCGIFDSAIEAHS